MNIQPIGDRVLVLPDDPQARSKAGLYQPKTKTDIQPRGKVVGVGEGEHVRQFKKGDILIFQRFSSQEVMLNKKKHVLVHFDEILGKEIQ